MSEKNQGNSILKAVDQQLKKPVWRFKDRSPKSEGINDNHNKLGIHKKIYNMKSRALNVRWESKKWGTFGKSLNLTISLKHTYICMYIYK